MKLKKQIEIEIKCTELENKQINIDHFSSTKCAVISQSKWLPSYSLACVMEVTCAKLVKVFIFALA